MPHATHHEHIGHALEAAIRSRVQSRSWYRRNREQYRWADFERENDRDLRLLFAVRSEARRAERASRAHAERIERELRAAHEVAEAAMWEASVSMGRYIVVDLPLADPGDHFVGRTA